MIYIHCLLRLLACLPAAIILCFVKKHESDARRGSVAHKSPNLNGYAKSKGKKKEGNLITE
jgi:hypothetical protein